MASQPLAYGNEEVWTRPISDFDVFTNFAFHGQELLRKLQLSDVIVSDHSFTASQIDSLMAMAGLALISRDDLKAHHIQASGQDLKHSLVITGILEDPESARMEVIESRLQMANVVFVRPEIPLEKVLNMPMGEFASPKLDTQAEVAELPLQLREDQIIPDQVIDQSIAVVHSKLEQVLSSLEMRPELIQIRVYANRVMARIDEAATQVEAPKTKILIDGLTVLAGVMSLTQTSPAHESITTPIDPIPAREPVVQVDPASELPTPAPEVVTETAFAFESAEISSVVLEDLVEFRAGFERLGRDRALDRNPIIPVVGDPAERTRHQYLHDYFLEEGETHIPDEIRQRLALIIPGLAAQESVFDNNALSSSGAMAVLQIMSPAYQDYVNRNRARAKDLTGREIMDLKWSLRLQTEVALYHFGVIYRHLDNNIDYESIGERYGLNETELNNFKVWTMVNAYNAGQGRMEGLINRFTSVYASAEDLPEYYDQTGITLQKALSEYGYRDHQRRRGTSNPSLYGEEASEYVFKVLAGAEALNDRFETHYGLDLQLNESIPALR
jgi:hypothetical protein